MQIPECLRTSTKAEATQYITRKPPLAGHVFAGSDGNLAQTDLHEEDDDTKHMTYDKASPMSLEYSVLHASNSLLTHRHNEKEDLPPLKQQNSGMQQTN